MEWYYWLIIVLIFLIAFFSGYAVRFFKESKEMGYALGNFFEKLEQASTDGNISEAEWKEIWGSGKQMVLEVKDVALIFVELAQLITARYKRG